MTDMDVEIILVVVVGAAHLSSVWTAAQPLSRLECWFGIGKMVGDQ